MKCGSKYMLHIHHIVHRSVAEACHVNDIDNLILLCHNCHMRHHNGEYEITVLKEEGMPTRYKFSDSYIFGKKNEK